MRENNKVIFIRADDFELSAPNIAKITSGSWSMLSIKSTDFDFSVISRRYLDSVQMLSVPEGHTSIDLDIFPNLLECNWEVVDKATNKWYKYVFVEWKIVRQPVSDSYWYLWNQKKGHSLVNFLNSK